MTTAIKERPSVSPRNRSFEDDPNHISRPLAAVLAKIAQRCVESGAVNTYPPGLAFEVCRMAVNARKHDRQLALCLC